LHWINQGFLSLKDIEKLTRLGKPIVWTMHDQWPYTGVCHYVGDCDRFTSHCFHCPQMNQNKQNDFSYHLFEKKKQLFQTQRFTFVGCSHWIAQQAEKNPATTPVNITNIPNAINTALYRPLDKQQCRQFFNLPSDKKLILFGACKATDKRKGVDYLISSCDLLSQRSISSELCIVVFGAKSEELSSLVKIPVINVGYIHNADQMVQLYNAVDLFLIPSLEDNLPNTIMESMACGTPCVGFDTGGIQEMIDHNVNGYVANYSDAEDLSRGIQWVLEEADYGQLSQNARKKVEECYSEVVVAKQYKELYQQMLIEVKR
jgi:glycosyltransferase involved in cell wall biosynthesis